MAAAVRTKWEVVILTKNFRTFALAISCLSKVNIVGNFTVAFRDYCFICPSIMHVFLGPNTNLCVLSPRILIALHIDWKVPDD